MSLETISTAATNLIKCKLLSSNHTSCFEHRLLLSKALTDTVKSFDIKDDFQFNNQEQSNWLVLLYVLLGCFDIYDRYDASCVKLVEAYISRTVEEKSVISIKKIISTFCSSHHISKSSHINDLDSMISKLPLKKKNTKKTVTMNSGNKTQKTKKSLKQIPNEKTQTTSNKENGFNADIKVEGSVEDIEAKSDSNDVGKNISHRGNDNEPKVQGGIEGVILPSSSDVKMEEECDGKTKSITGRKRHLSDDETTQYSKSDDTYIDNNEEITENLKKKKNIVEL